MAKIKVLHIIKSLGRGGAEMLLPETLKLHNQEQFEFHYIYFLPWKNQMVKAIEDAGGKVTCLTAKNNISLLLQYSKIIQYCKDNEIQLIHAHLPWAGVLARLVGRSSKIPIVYTEHNNFDRYHVLTKFLSSITYRWQKKVIAVSEDAKRALESRKLHDNIEYVPNGVDTNFFSPLKIKNRLLDIEGLRDTSHIVGTVAVFRRQKRLDILLEVARESMIRDLKFKFLLVGDGPEMNMIKDTVVSLGLNNVKLVGLKDNPIEYMRYMSAFLITSDFEGLPVALLEAMSLGIVPFSTKVGGIPNVIINELNGILLENQNPKEIVDKLQMYILDRPEELQLMGVKSRDTIINNFSISKMVLHLESIYQEILANG